MDFHVTLKIPCAPELKAAQVDLCTRYQSSLSGQGIVSEVAEKESEVMLTAEWNSLPKDHNITSCLSQFLTSLNQVAGLEAQGSSCYISCALFYSTVTVSLESAHSKSRQRYQ